MLSRSLRKKFATLAKDLNSKMSEVESRLKGSIPASVLGGTPFEVPEESPQKTMDQKLADLDSSIAKIEALREAGRPEEVRIKNLHMKYGRAGRHPGYQWYGNAVAPEDKVPHLADRLGKYSEMGSVNTELNDWLQMKSDQNNPLFHSFYVNEPSRKPDPDVDFEKGEIIYDNPYAFQGSALAKQTCWASLGLVAFHMLHTAGSGRTVYPIGNEGMDHRTDGYDPGQNYALNVYQFYGDWQDIETLGGVGFIAPLAPLAAVAVVSFIKTLTDGVCVKMQFNKNRDLVFVTKVGGVFMNKPYEEVYETTHLQVLPPSPASGFALASDREVFTINCMASHESFRVMNNPEYWNPELKGEFYRHLHSLWS
jgi:hypothetical protein